MSQYGINNLVFHAWNMDHCEFIVQGLFLKILESCLGNITEWFPDNLRKGLCLTAIMKFSYPNAKSDICEFKARAFPSMGANWDSALCVKWPLTNIVFHPVGQQNGKTQSIDNIFGGASTQCRAWTSQWQGNLVKFYQRCKSENDRLWFLVEQLIKLICSFISSLVKCGSWCQQLGGITICGQWWPSRRFD